MKCQHVHRSSGHSSTLVLARHGRSAIISTTRASCPNALSGAEVEEDAGASDDESLDWNISPKIALGLAEFNGDERDR